MTTRTKTDFSFKISMKSFGQNPYFPKSGSDAYSEHGEISKMDFFAKTQS